MWHAVVRARATPIVCARGCWAHGSDFTALVCSGRDVHVCSLAQPQARVHGDEHRLCGRDRVPEPGRGGLAVNTPERCCGRCVRGPRALDLRCGAGARGLSSSNSASTR